MKNPQGQEVTFESAAEMLGFLKTLNPSLLNHYKKEYAKQFPGYEIRGIGQDLKVVRRAA